MSTQLELPSGPPTTVPPKATREGYHAWRWSEDGRRVFDAVERKALTLASNGARRIGVKGLIEDVRRELKLAVNNSHTVLVADELARRHEHLRAVIERRKRHSAALHGEAA